MAYAIINTHHPVWTRSPFAWKRGPRRPPVKGMPTGRQRATHRNRSRLDMARLVMKFGGTSVADLERMRHAVRHVAREVAAGNQVCVVVSAMAGKTNELVRLTRDAAPLHDAREYDTVVASGEQVVCGLLAIILQSQGIAARSWLGWQLPVHTNDTHGAARITGIEARKLIDRLEEGQVAVIAGFQGLGPDYRITTLGRGGTDTSAVAIAAAINADRCDIYTDVDGVYTTDPRIVATARRIDRIAYEEMLEMASLGAKVLQTRSVELALVQGVKLLVRSSFADADAPVVVDGERAGTLVCNEGDIVEKNIVSGITYTRDESKITLRRVRDKPGVAAAVFGPLSQANINVDMIIQNISEDGRTTDMTFTIPTVDYARAVETIEAAKDTIGYEELNASSDVVKISVVGIGMRSHAGVASTMFRALSDKNINIQLISTSEIKISVLIDADYGELAVRTLHTAYGLDRP